MLPNMKCIKYKLSENFCGKESLSGHPILGEHQVVHGRNQNVADALDRHTTPVHAAALGFALVKSRQIDRHMLVLPAIQAQHWIDFAKPLPTNPAYSELHDAFCPAGWSPEVVREVYRQGLCSLASQLLKNRD